MGIAHSANCGHPEDGKKLYIDKDGHKRVRCKFCWRDYRRGRKLGRNRPATLPIVKELARKPW